MSFSLPVSPNESHFLFTNPGIDTASMLVVAFEAREAISEPFEVHLNLVSESGVIALGDVVGESGLLTIVHSGGTRWFHGTVKSFQVSRASRSLTHYRAVIVPWLWLLTQRRDCRIFQGMSTPEILEEVLAAAGIEGDWLESRFSGTYSPRDYCVQYRETDFAFASRLMEEDGIFYYFEHSADGHVMVLGDNAMAHDYLVEGANIEFRPPQMSAGTEQYIQEVTLTRSVRPGKTTLRDYTFKEPTTNLEVQDESSENTDLEVYDYPGEYVDAGVGQALVQARLERLQVDREVLTGHGDARRFCPGFLFTLASHHRSDLNQEYLLTRIVHTGSQPIPRAPSGGSDHTYANRFEAIPATTTFRPARTTPRPSVPGIQTARVTGPEGEDIQVDEFGRIKVKFHWDRSDEENENSSCWLRVSHGWAGAGFGHVFLPRIGQEVIVQFIEGDIDRPIVTGRVYNGDNLHPYELPGEQTKSTIKTDSSPDHNGFNELRFEDKQGSEEIYLHAQKDQNEQVNNDHTQNVDNDQTMTVKNNRTREVTSGNETITIAAGTQTITIKAGQAVTINSGGQTFTIEAGGQTIEITDFQKETIHGNHDQTIDGKSTIKVDGGDRSVKASAGKMLLESSGDMNLESTGGNMSAKASGNVDVTAQGGVIIQSHFGVRSCLRGVDIRTTVFKSDTVVVLAKNVMFDLKKESVAINSGGISVQLHALLTFL